VGASRRGDCARAVSKLRREHIGQVASTKSARWLMRERES
jgi:hypothetical protein